MNAAASVSFEFCIKRAKVASIMCQYGAMDGMPSCANAKINNALYRDTYGWDGFLVSDCDAVADFASHLNITTDAQAAAYGIKGGLDVDCGTSYASITDAVKQGLVSETAVRTAAERFLAKQIALGALETTPFDRVGPAVVDSAEHRKLALDAAAQSLVLLRNEKVVSHAGSAPLLPFSADAKLVFIGPHTTSTVDLLGNYHGVNLQVLNRSIADVATQRGLRFSIADSAAGVGDADIAVLFLGLTTREEGEGRDRTSLELPPDQLMLLANVTAVQPRTAVVLVNGGALAIEALVAPGSPHQVPAILEAFYPGQAGAEAIIGALLGEINPSGRLPYTMFPAGLVNRSAFDFDLQSDGGLTYQYYDGKYGKAVYEFGHGLSYTTFTYEWASEPRNSVDVKELAVPGHGGCYSCESLQFSIKVTNTGARSGAAVVLGFVTMSTPSHGGSSNTTAGGMAKKRALFDFGRVALAAGSSTTLTLKMDGGCKQAVSMVDESGVRWVEPGRYSVSVGDAAAPATHAFEVAGTRAAIDASCAL